MNAPVAELSPVKRALLEIRELRARLAELEDAAREPIAIVGLGIRAPGGVRDAASYAELLWGGVDAITPIPPDRWSLEAWYDESQDAAGKMTTRLGGFLADVQHFDAEFFGIAPVEAASMDPQQRLLLQLAWEALENAGHAPASLAGSRSGVYLGIANSDYGRALFAHPQAIDPYFSTGCAFSVASGRLSYFLGLQGPAVSLDTACSSSLVALHLACQGLRQGECELALAGGINLVLTPELNVNFSKAGMMARDGRCKTFDAAADGYVRGEGGAMLVLRRLRDAQADGDRVLAVIRGSAINQDGRSNGLTAPNGPAQEAVIRAALQSANVTPAQIGYVEAHGTGTPLGDPIEVNALAAVLGEGRAAGKPVLLGSVKTNIGHLEAAAGVAGVIKTVLALQRREIPPHLHFKSPNPYIDWATLPVAVATGVTAWSPIDGRRLAGVSSFGFSGTNAHVILEEAPAEGTVEPAAAGGLPTRPAHILALSARDPQTLQEVVARYAGVLEGATAAGADLADICFTANAGRSHFAHRIAVTGPTAAAMRDALSTWRSGASHSSVAAGAKAPQPPRVAFLFPGQGPQYAGMGRSLYQTSPVFRAALDECVALLDKLLPQPLLPVIFDEAGAALDETSYAQPAMFAMEIALAALWRSWGIEPIAVMGHSFGEYAAACVAGAMSIADAARMVVARGRLVQSLPRNGAMTVIEASEEAVRAALARYAGRVAIAAINGPSNTVISGERVAVDEIAARFAASGARTKPLRVSHAFHSPLVDPVLEEFTREIGGTQYSEPRLPLVSNLSGKLADVALIGNAAYWRDHMRQPVRFADSLQKLACMGVTHYIEMSPHPVLLGMGAECLPGVEAEWLPSLHRERADWTDLLASLQRLYVSGAEVDWPGFDRGSRRKRVALPTYPFRERRHWMDIVGKSVSAGVGAAERWTRVTDASRRQSEQGPLDLNASSYPAKWSCLARLTAAHAIATLRDAGLFLRAQERHTLEQMMSAAQIGATYKHLVQRWLDRLVGLGVLQVAGSAYVAPQPLPEPKLQELWAEADRLFVDNAPLLDYVRHCGSLVSAVLRGQESPLETLFPGGSPDLARGLYERSSTMRYINELAAAAFSSLSAATPAGGAVRILEVGAGTGGTTASLLPVLAADRTRYVFTDMSDLFLDRARERFAAYPFVDYRLFNMERDPAEQGFAPGSFDVIVSANAVHASTDLRLTLRRLRELLAPGGMLVLVESTVHMDWFDMTTGLIEGWQHFADDLRTDNPLLPPETWRAALRDAGFVVAETYPGEGSAAGALGQHLVLGLVPGELAGWRADSVAAESGSPSAAVAGTTPAAAVTAAAFKQRVLEAVADERLDLLRDFVRGEVVRVLKLDAAEPPGRHDRLMDLGLDSLMAVQLRNQLAKGSGLDKPLPATIMFDQPTIEALAGYLLERIVAAGGSARAGAQGAAGGRAGDGSRVATGGGAGGVSSGTAAGAVAASGTAGPGAGASTGGAVLGGADGAATGGAVLGEAAVAAMSEEQIEALLLERLGKS